MKELDIVLERFARAELSGASAAQRQVLARFLELSDPTLVEYLLGNATPPEPELADLVRRIAAQRIAARRDAAQPDPIHGPP